MRKTYANGLMRTFILFLSVVNTGLLISLSSRITESSKSFIIIMIYFFIISGFILATRKDNKMNNKILGLLENIARFKYPADITTVQVEIGKIRVNAEKSNGNHKIVLHESANQIERDLKIAIAKKQ